jgi:hypothetical protein
MGSLSSLLKSLKSSGQGTNADAGSGSGYAFINFEIVDEKHGQKREAAAGCTRTGTGTCSKSVSVRCAHFDFAE